MRDWKFAKFSTHCSGGSPTAGNTRHRYTVSIRATIYTGTHSKLTPTIDFMQPCVRSLHLSPTSGSNVCSSSSFIFIANHWPVSVSGFILNNWSWAANHKVFSFAATLCFFRKRCPLKYFQKCKNMIIFIDLAKEVEAKGT